jgi:hypothetical protein
MGSVIRAEGSHGNQERWREKPTQPKSAIAKHEQTGCHECEHRESW